MCKDKNVQHCSLCLNFLHLSNEPKEIPVKSRVNSAEEKEESPFLNIRAGRGHTYSNDPLIKELKNKNCFSLAYLCVQDTCNHSLFTC